MEQEAKERASQQSAHEQQEEAAVQEHKRKKASGGYGDVMSHQELDETLLRMVKEHRARTRSSAAHQAEEVRVAV